MMNRRWVQIAVTAVFLAVAVISMANTWTMARYIRHTEPRDAAQEQCIIAQSAWLQDWLKWRWVEHVDATTEQIIEYHRLNPQPPCTIKRP